MTTVPTDAFWAKLTDGTDDERGGTGGAWHPLSAHCADVAAVTRCLLQPGSPLGSRLAESAGLDALSDSTRSALVYLAALHDVGKANHGFQEKRHPNGERRSFERSGHVKVVHESLGFRPLDETLVHLLQPFGEEPENAYRLFQASLFHHGRPWGESASAPRDRGRLWLLDESSGRDPLAEMRRIAALARRWSGIEGHAAPIALPEDPAFTHLFAGLVMLADWIGSTEAAFPFDPSADADPEAYWRRAARQAERACARIGVIPRCQLDPGSGEELYRRVFPDIFEENSPTPLQSWVMDMPLPDEGSRMLIESETGSGKTEAALALYARLRAAGRTGGLLFALPTRATATAMHERVVAALEGMYPPGELPTVALAMGGSGLRAEAEERFFEAARTQYDENPDWKLAQWSSSHTKKFFAAEVVVGTIDQVLLSGLVVDHAHLRLAALSRHLLVVDELHSYDRYMSEVLAHILDFHTQAGGMSLFMSATLSDVERRRYGGDHEGEPSLRDAVERAYPVISIRERDGTGWQDTDVPSPADDGPASRSKTVRWEPTTELQGIEAAVAAAERGARVCVLRNLVKDARSTVERIRDEEAERRLWGPPESPHAPAYHSRYCTPDRTALDEAVLDRFGPEAQNDASGVILVATQVVEQSLDVDFDLLITDLCPIDVLLQRIGRLHRHAGRDAHRPDDYEKPRVMVVAPREGFESLAGEGGYGPHGWGTVYRDLGDLELTRRLVADPERPRIRIPAQNRELVEQVYHASQREELRAESDAWEGNFIENEGRNLGRECHARNVTLDFDDDYALNAGRWTAHFAEGKIRTRLGDDRIRVELGRPIPTFYSEPMEPVETLDLPTRALGGDWDGDLPEVHEWTRTNEGVSFRLGNAGPIRYDPNGWHW